MQTTKRSGSVALPYLAAWRESQFLSQEQLSKQSGVSRSAISDAEGGRPIRLFNAKKLADALKITPKQLLGAPDMERAGSVQA